MRGKQILLSVLLLGMCFSAVCCATDRVASDLVNYVNQDILSIADLERKPLERYASVTGENYTTDQRVYEALKDFVVPVYGQFLDALRNINPEEEEVKRLHATLIRGAELLHRGFKMKLVGLEQKNDNIIREGNEMIEKGRIENERWRKELVALADKHNIGARKEEKKTEKE